MCEVVRQIYVNTSHKEMLIKNQYKSDGVIIACTIANINHTFVRILNTTDTNKIINISNIEYEPSKTTK